ncbi:hypothetical protein pkur_cds_69 [Pandoravirus kuranda]|uniref:Uncharacterized protein n=1 Tax=Pandoravirus kuranda TaxID=3019033 RepID=A0AA95EHT1_9VIRU|nr:hypothetical protein pkur_cds_69 [Pandoravirus kuranda]
MIHQLHGRLWGAYAPFWALVSRIAVQTPTHDARHPTLPPPPLCGPPTLRNQEIILLSSSPSLSSLEQSHEAATSPPRTGACGPHGTTVSGVTWMEIDQGACMATVARLRAVALAKRMARDATYPSADDTRWATGRHALLAALGASPDTKLLLTVKDRRHVLADGTRVTSRKVSLRANFAVCPFVATTQTTQGAARARPRRRTDSEQYSIVACAYNHTVATGGAQGQAEVGSDARDESTSQRRRDGMSPTIACMQRLCVGKYMLDGWLSRIAHRSRDALHTIALLNRAPPTVCSRDARSGALGFCATSPYAIGRVSVVRRQIALDGCLVAILVRDAYVVQPAVRAAESRLFGAAHRLSVTPPPDRALDRRAAADAMRLLNGNPRANMSPRRTLGALRYATWYACAAGHPDGYDAALVTSLLDRVGFHPTRGLVARLVLLWSP